MTFRMSGRSVLIIAAGICVFFAGPLQAAEDGESGEQATKIGSATAGKPVALNKFTKHAAQHWKKRASVPRKSSRLAWKSPHHKALGVAEATAESDAAPAALPPEIADANAQLTAAEAPAEANPPLADPTAVDVQARAAADAGLVSADQLNDIDRALTESNASAPLVTMAAANVPAVISLPTTVASTQAVENLQTIASAEDTAWSKSSIIGKIFIAFGGILTLASAARMIMA